jgi:VanZ family protein
MPEINIVNFDKLGHFAVFGILHFLFIRIIGQSSDGISPHFLLYNSTTAMLVIAYGGLMEWMQGAFYTDRSADIYDAVANATGVLISFTLVSFFPKLVHHKMGRQ